MDEKLQTRKALITFAVILGIFAGLDVLTTHYGLTMGAVELNPLFQHQPISMVATIKISVIAAIIIICIRFHTVVGLALVTGATASCVVANIATILLLR